jgi:uncharacterized membrane protein
MKKIIVLILAIMAVTYACKHEPMLKPVQKDPTPPDTIPAGSTGVCFTKDVLPIFQSYCAKAGCHDAITHEDDLVLNSYDNIIKDEIKPGDANNSKMYRVIISTDPDEMMPPPGNQQLTPAQKDIIKKWIDEGAKNTACNTVCDVTLYTYSGFVQPVLQKNCIGCHSGATAAGNINLSIYNTVKGVALSGKFYGAITHATGYKPMPNTNSKLPDCEITQIKKWIDAGAPQN